MRILIVCQTMEYLSGSPLYNFTVAKELKNQGHDVSVYSRWSDNELRKELVSRKIMTRYSIPDEEQFDLVLISQPDHKDILCKVKSKKTINIIHSEYNCETPIIENIDEYIAIRPQVKEHLVSQHNIPKEKIRVIYNGIDLKKFSPKKRNSNKEDYIKVVLPCTLDLLRKKFIEHYTRRASEKYRIYIYGKDYKNSIYKNKWVFINEEVFDIENYIADADIVAGILLGRVNLEARAMGIVSMIHDPENPKNYDIYFPEEFEKIHDITRVVKEIIK